MSRFGCLQQKWRKHALVFPQVNQLLRWVQDPLPQWTCLDLRPHRERRRHLQHLRHSPDNEKETKQWTNCGKLALQLEPILQQLVVLPRPTWPRHKKLQKPKWLKEAWHPCCSRACKETNPGLKSPSFHPIRKP